MSQLWQVEVYIMMCDGVPILDRSDVGVCCGLVKVWHCRTDSYELATWLCTFWLRYLTHVEGYIAQSSMFLV